jgi:hypothetical protein
MNRELEENILKGVSADVLHYVRDISARLAAEIQQATMVEQVTMQRASDESYYGGTRYGRLLVRLAGKIMDTIEQSLSDDG